MFRATLTVIAAFAVLAITGIATAAGPQGAHSLAPTSRPIEPPVAPHHLGSHSFGIPETIDLDALAEGIESAFTGKVVGYSYAIARNGAVVRKGHWGLRRLGVDGGDLSFTDDTMSQAASTSKTVTAAALIKALVARGLTVDTKIGSYLPDCWAKGPNVANFTFRDVLGHHTILPDGTGCSTDPLKCLLEVVAKGRGPVRWPDYDHDGTPDKPYKYSNTAYGLVRVLLPFVLSNHELQATFGDSSDYCLSHTAELNEIVSSRFRDYVLEDVLGPVGVQASFYPQGDGSNDWAYVYNNGDRSQPGGLPRSDFYLHSGAGYLAISARAYVKFLSALDAGLIVQKSLAEEMKGVPDNRMGFDTAADGTLGAYVWKNGGCPSANGTKPGCAALGMVYPNGMQAYVVINSSNNTYSGTAQSILKNAFDAALL